MWIRNRNEIIGHASYKILISLVSLTTGKHNSIIGSRWNFCFNWFDRVKKTRTYLKKKIKRNERKDADKCNILVEYRESNMERNCHSWLLIFMLFLIFNIILISLTYLTFPDDIFADIFDYLTLLTFWILFLILASLLLLIRWTFSISLIYSILLILSIFSTFLAFWPD